MNLPVMVAAMLLFFLLCAMVGAKAGNAIGRGMALLWMYWTESK